MNKKILVSLATLLMGFSLVACNSSDENDGTNDGSASNEVAEVSGDWKPDDSVETIVAYKAGSGTDTTARLLTEYANEYIGETMVIENLEGGSGSIGWTRLAESKNDGQTIGFVNFPTLASNIVEDLATYSMDDFVPICNHVTETSLILVDKDSEFDTLDDLVEYAQEHPGELKASTNGNKASNHIAAQLFAKSADFKYSAIPYGGTADQLLALRQNEVDFTSAKEADIASIESEVKVLGVFNEERLEDLPDVPTLGELGYYDKWYGSARAIAAPKDTPDEIIKFYEKAFKQAMEDERYLETAEKAGATTNYKSAEETKKMFDEQYKFTSETVTEIWDD